jgi:hypothetical protein
MIDRGAESRLLPFRRGAKASMVFTFDGMPRGQTPGFCCMADGEPYFFGLMANGQTNFLALLANITRSRAHGGARLHGALRQAVASGAGWHTA